MKKYSIVFLFLCVFLFTRVSFAQEIPPPSLTSSELQSQLQALYAKLIDLLLQRLAVLELQMADLKTQQQASTQALQNSIAAITPPAASSAPAAPPSSNVTTSNPSPAEMYPVFSYTAKRLTPADNDMIPVGWRVDYKATQKDGDRVTCEASEAGQHAQMGSDGFVFRPFSRGFHWDMTCTDQITLLIVTSTVYIAPE